MKALAKSCNMWYVTFSNIYPICYIHSHVVNGTIRNDIADLVNFKVFMNYFWVCTNPVV